MSRKYVPLINRALRGRAYTNKLRHGNGAIPPPPKNERAIDPLNDVLLYQTTDQRRMVFGMAMGNFHLSTKVAGQTNITELPALFAQEFILHGFRINGVDYLMGTIIPEPRVLYIGLVGIMDRVIIELSTTKLPTVFPVSTVENISVDRWRCNALNISPNSLLDGAGIYYNSSRSMPYPAELKIVSRQTAATTAGFPADPIPVQGEFNGFYGIAGIHFTVAGPDGFYVRDSAPTQGPKARVVSSNGSGQTFSESGSVAKIAVTTPENSATPFRNGSIVYASQAKPRPCAGEFVPFTDTGCVMDVSPVPSNATPYQIGTAVSFFVKNSETVVMTVALN